MPFRHAPSLAPSPILPPPPPAETKPLWGFADTHTHLMTHVSHGGKTAFGKPWDARGLQGAMPHCDSVHGPGGILPSAELLHRTGGYPEYDGWPKFTTQTHHQA